MSRLQVEGLYILLAVLTVGTIFYSLFDLRRSYTSIENRIEEMSAFSSTIQQEKIDSVPVKSFTPELTFRSDMETLKEQVSFLAQDFDILKNQIKGLSSTISFGEEEKEEAISSRVGAKSSNQENRVDLDTQYNNEIRDEEWASTIEHDIVQGLTANELFAGVSINEIDCRSSLCRFNWEYPTGLSNYDAFVMENEMLVVLSKVGLNASSQIGNGESIFWHQPSPPKRQRD